MRLEHFHHFAPVCPLCIQNTEKYNPLDLHVVKGTPEWIEEGNMVCNTCSAIYPVIKGIPILVPNVGQFMQTSYVHTLWDTNITPHHFQWMSEAAGAGSIVEGTRNYLSTYMHSHYGDLEPESHSPNQIESLLQHSKQEQLDDGPILDIGCSVGRSTFELAKTYNRPVLGIDLNFAMLLHAQDVLLRNRVGYGLRNIGSIYDWKEYAVDFSHRHLVDFWIADATCLPFAAQQVALSNSLNVLDCANSPITFLSEITRLSKQWHIYCPYDWSANVTDFSQWLGGHGKFLEWEGQPEKVIRYLLSEQSPAPMLKHAHIQNEIPYLPWQVRVHSRSTVQYQVHYIHAKVFPPSSENPQENA